MEAKYPVRTVAQRTGLSPHVIRIWERRYGAVTPQRSPTNRRVYTDGDLKKLSLLGQLVELGHSIGEIANLPTETLKKMLDEEKDTLISPSALTSESKLAGSFMREALKHILNLDEKSLAQTLEQASLQLSQRHLIEKLLAPLMCRVGELWEKGTLRVAQEHFATCFLRSYISGLKTSYGAHIGRPTLVVATLRHQVHEIGAMLAAKTADAEGWNVIYLGTNLPAEEIAASIKQTQSQALALSLVYPPNDPEVIAELEQLRKFLPLPLPLFIGGRSAKSYLSTIKKCSATFVASLAEFRNVLGKI